MAWARHGLELLTESTVSGKPLQQDHQQGVWAHQQQQDSKQEQQEPLVDLAILSASARALRVSSSFRSGATSCHQGCQAVQAGQVLPPLEASVRAGQVVLQEAKAVQAVLLLLEAHRGQAV